MTVTIKDVIGITKELPESYLEEAYEALKGIKDKAEREKESKPVECPHCDSAKVVRRQHL